MTLIKNRKCPECSGDMSPKLINMHYKKKYSEIQVDVIGIPANVCSKCFYRIIPGKIAKYIDSIIDPIFASEINKTESFLPPPHIGIQFPPNEQSSFYHSNEVRIH